MARLVPESGHQLTAGGGPSMSASLCTLSPTLRLLRGSCAASQPLKGSTVRPRGCALMVNTLRTWLARSFVGSRASMQGQHAGLQPPRQTETSSSTKASVLLEPLSVEEVEQELPLNKNSLEFEVQWGKYTILTRSQEDGTATNFIFWITLKVNKKSKT